MSIRFRNLLLIVLVAAFAADAQAQPRPRLKKKLAGAPPIVFYLAKGAPDACGPGCSEWIAADGPIDSHAVARMRRLLLRLGDRRLPIFFHSNGGSQSQSLAMGRLLRARGMTAGVGRTVPQACATLSVRECGRLIQSGRPLEAELRSIATCASACVYALIGGTARQVPPGARLVVHASRLIQMRADGSTVTLRASASKHNKDLHARLNAQLRSYIQEMGIDTRLLQVILKTPNELAYRLTRDEIVGFRIDSRQFQETRWMEVDIADREFYVGKFLAKPTGLERKAFRTSVIQLSCDASRGVKLTYARGLASDDVGRPVDLKLSIGGQSVDLSQSGSVRGMGWFETSETFDLSFGDVPYETLDAAAARGSMELAEADANASAAEPRAIRLSTQGLPEALTWLRERCAVRR